MTESQQPQGNDPAKPGIPFKNAGEPIKLSGLQLNGVTAEAAREGEPIKIWTRLYLTSDDRFFHYAVESLSGHLARAQPKISQAQRRERHPVCWIEH